MGQENILYYHGAYSYAWKERVPADAIASWDKNQYYLAPSKQEKESTPKVTNKNKKKKTELRSGK